LINPKRYVKFYANGILLSLSSEGIFLIIEDVGFQDPSGKEDIRWFKK
jgi:hypothetical protein